MEDLIKKKSDYLQSVQDLDGCTFQQMRLVEEICSLCKESSAQSETLGEKDFLLGYFGFFYNRELNTSYEAAFRHIQAAHEAGYLDASIFLSKLHLGKYAQFSNLDISEQFDLSKGYKILEELRDKENPYALYFYAKASLDVDNDNIDMDIGLVKKNIQECKRQNFLGGYFLEALSTRNGDLNGFYDHEKGEALMERARQNATVHNFHLIDIYYDLLHELGIIYYSAIGKERDTKTSYAYLNKAAKAGHSESISFLEHARFSREDMEAAGSGTPFITVGKSTEISFQEDVIGSDEITVWSEDSDYSYDNQSSGYSTLQGTGPRDHAPETNVYIHYPEEKNPIFNNYINETPEKQEEIIEILLEPLQKLPGLEFIKKEVKSLVDSAFINIKREELGLKSHAVGKNMLFLGNPGTGKTITARMLGNIFYQVGLIKKGHVVEADTNSLIGEYVGWSAAKTKTVCEAALDGILFIDEAYAISETDLDFGSQVISTLIKFMEDNADRLIVIAAGYKDRMQNFITSNPGLRSRFSNTIMFSDYTPKEMTAIFHVFSEDNDYRLSADAEDKLYLYLKALKGNDLGRFANALGVRNLFDSTIKRQSERLLKEGVFEKEKMMEIIADDIPSSKTIIDGNISYLPNTKD